MRKRVCGLETEMLSSYLSPLKGLVSQHEYGNFQVEQFLRFLREKFGEFYFSEAIAGAFLTNQAQVYIDTTGKFLEVCTPECSSIKDFVLHKRVSNAIVADTLREFKAQLKKKNEELGLAVLYFHHRASDNRKRGICACHENYQGEKKITRGATREAVASWSFDKGVKSPFDV